MSDAPHRRDVWEVKLDKPRPAVVLSREQSISGLPTVVVVPFSTTMRNVAPPAGIWCAAGVGGLQADSVAICRLVKAVEKKLLVRYLGRIPPDYFWRIIDGVLAALHFDEVKRVSWPEKTPHSTCRSSGAGNF